MKIFGFDFGFTVKKSLQAIPSTGGWFPLVRESSPGAWQAGQTLEADTLLAHSAVFACVSLISSDIGKLPVQIATQRAGYWERQASPFDVLLKKPNLYQNRAQFFAAWASSKLLHGNVYALKTRDARGRITALHLLDPKAVTPLISSDGGAVFYRLNTNHLAGIGSDATVPAREIIHDRGVTPFHPLIGVSPLIAASLGANQALSIQSNSQKFFQNGSRPGGILTAPGEITPATAERLRAHWQENFSGENYGKTAVLGDGLKYEAMTTNAVDAQLIEQLNFTAQDVCRAFHVPAWKIGAGPAAPYTGVEAMNLAYYSDCLQWLIESLELALDEGLDLPSNQRTEFDLDHLLRMDTTTRYSAYTQAIGGGWMKPNEARAREGLPPVEGGDTCYMQQQNFALAALANRQAPNLQGGQP